MRLPPWWALLGLLCVGLTACGQTRGNNQDPNSPDYSGEAGSDLNQMGSLTGGDNTFTFGVNHQPRHGETGGGAGTGLAVNAYLWRGALDTLSFMPLASADPFGGVIITDWYSPPDVTGERFKATAYILSRDLTSNGVRVAIYRQVLQNGQWVDAPVSPTTVGEIENKVLDRARQLRAASQASG
jgi:hypothetical protein